jgi:signal peptidase I
MPDEDLYIGPTTLAPAPAEPSGSGDRIARLILIPLAVALIALLLVFYVFFEPGRVVGPSMLPTLRSGDMVLLTRGYRRPRRGDIVFTQVTEQGVPVEIVKRVIGVPGDTVEVRQDVAVVNGVPEPARGQYIDPMAGDSVAAYRIPAGHIYVMGDNRPDSEDSRYIGPVPLSGVKGRVVALYAPINRIGRVR